MQKTLLITALLLVAGCSEKTEESAAAQAPASNKASDWQVPARNKTTAVPAPASNESADDQTFNQSFIKSCTDGSLRTGQISAADADKICQCSLRRFKKKYSSAQAVAVFNHGAEAEKLELAQFSMEVGMECAKQWQAGEL